jgi:hypothetical protein
MDTPASPSAPLVLLRKGLIGGAANETPAATGPVNALNTATTFWGMGSPSLGPPEGGGASMDQLGRVTIVGSSNGPGFPVTAGGLGYSLLMTDGVRAVVDMLPVGVCRTDGTGSCGVLPQSPFTGGTTPSCALSPFGNLIGSSPPALWRMMIDFEGTLAPGFPAALLLDRPPANVTVLGTFVQFSLPATQPQIVDQVEIWTTSSPFLFVSSPPGNASIRFPLGTLPPPSPSGFLASAQFVSLIALPFSCNGFSFVGSPALTLSY